MRYSFVSFFLSIGLILTSCSEEPKSGEVKDVGLELNDEIDLDEPEEVPNIDSEVANSKLSDWKFYYNQRYEFCVDYPSNFLKEIGESENRDGNTFANANGSSEMRASGVYNALDETVEEAFARATKDGRYYDDEHIITYKRQKDDWFVVSGKYNESIFYARTILIEGTFYSLYFEYHSSEEDKFKEIIKRTTKDFPGC